MKHFQKIAEGFPQIAEHHALLNKDLVGVQVLRQRGDNMIAQDLPLLQEVPSLKDRARALMALVNGVQLGGMSIVTLDTKSKLPVTSANDFYRTFLCIIYAQEGVMIMCGDETVRIRSGEFWWVRASEETYVINNSDDDCMVMMVEVRVDP